MPQFYYMNEDEFPQEYDSFKNILNKYISNGYFNLNNNLWIYINDEIEYEQASYLYGDTKNKVISLYHTIFTKYEEIYLEFIICSNHDLI